ncbi:MAG TPA: PAS domain S-box protein [Polyangiaceae bacterium]
MSVVEGDSVRRIYVSDVAAKLLGYSAEELIGSSTYLTYAPEEVERMCGLSQQWRTGGWIPHFLETVVVRKDGTRVPVEVAYSPVELDGKQATVAFLRDISERKRTEEAHRRSEELFRKLIEAAPESVLVTRGKRIVYANPCCLQLLGYDRLEELAQKTVVDVVHPDDRVSLEERRRLILELQTPLQPREYRLLCRDGRPVSIEASSLPIDFEGQPAILTFARDITERKERQAQLIQTDRMATIGTLAAGVAHELNNPLAYVLLNLGILERELDDFVDPEHRQRIQQRLCTLQEGAERMVTIVRDLRSFCRPDSPALVPVETQQILESAINMAMNELKDRARIVRDYAPVPPVLADGARLGQVFLNLLLNAAQALPDRDLRNNEVRIVMRLEGTDRACIEIIDSGHGIPPDIMGRIFEPFFTTKPVGVGTGLGLSICQSIVASFRGELVVETQVGRGSTFRLLLPLAPLVQASIPPAARAHRTDQRPHRAARILVVDDETAIASALKKVLDVEHQVTAVTTGGHALELLLQGTRFDVVVCDVLMPDVSGIDLYRELDSKRPELVNRIIFMSGASSLPRVTEFLAKVPNRWIDKPVNLEELRRLIVEITRQ